MTNRMAKNKTIVGFFILSVLVLPLVASSTIADISSTTSSDLVWVDKGVSSNRESYGDHDNIKITAKFKNTGSLHRYDATFVLKDTYTNKVVRERSRDGLIRPGNTETVSVTFHNSPSGWGEHEHTCAVAVTYYGGTLTKSISFNIYD